MVTTALTPELVEQGSDLIKSLDAAGASPDAAFWYYFADMGAWKLVLAEGKVGSTGPKGIYRYVQRALSLMKARTGISLDDVAIAKPDAPIVTVLRRALRTGPGITNVRFTHNVIDGVLIEDAHIYRLT